MRINIVGMCVINLPTGKTYLVDTDIRSRLVVIMVGGNDDAEIAVIKTRMGNEVLVDGASIHEKYTRSAASLGQDADYPAG